MDSFLSERFLGNWCVLVFVKTLICDGLPSVLLLSGCSVTWVCWFVNRIVANGSWFLPRSLLLWGCKEGNIVWGSSKDHGSCKGNMFSRLSKMMAATVRSYACIQK